MTIRTFTEYEHNVISNVDIVTKQVKVLEQGEQSGKFRIWHYCTLM